MAAGRMMAAAYRGISRRYLRGETRPYGCRSGSQSELIAGAARHEPAPAKASDRQTKGSTMSAPAPGAKEKPPRRVTLSRRVSFWAAAGFAFLAFAASTAASPLYRVY